MSTETPEVPQAPEPPANTFPVSEEPPSGLVMMGLASPLPAPGTSPEYTLTGVPLSSPVELPVRDQPDILAIINQNHAETMAMLAQIWQHITQQ